jgi:hypothetical protein
MMTETDPVGVLPSQPAAEKPKDFVTRLLPESGEGLLTVKEVAQQLGVCAATVCRYGIAAKCRMSALCIRSGSLTPTSLRSSARSDASKRDSPDEENSHLACRAA